MHERSISKNHADKMKTPLPPLHCPVQTGVVWGSNKQRRRQQFIYAHIHLKFCSGFTPPAPVIGDWSVTFIHLTWCLVVGWLVCSCLWPYQYALDGVVAYRVRAQDKRGSAVRTVQSAFWGEACRSSSGVESHLERKLFHDSVISQFILIYKNNTLQRRS